MALSKEELIGVIAGSLAGLILFLGILAVILYVCIGRRRKGRRRSDQKPFPHHHLTPDTSLSKNSALPPPHGERRVPVDPRMDSRADPRHDPRIESRLPKVGSSNLWFGTPSLYSGGPAPIYQDMKRKPGTNRPLEQPSLQAAPGHMVYQSGNIGRIYHSQQVAQVAMYDPGYRLHRSGSYMDVYSFGSPYSYDPYRDVTNSKAVLVDYQDPNTHYKDVYRERESRRTGKKVKRSQSDVTQHSTRRPKNRKQRGETPFPNESNDGKRRDRSSSHDRGLDADRTTKAEVHRPRSKKQAPAPPKEQVQDIYIHSTNLPDEEISQSATDSAKLRALEREKERERERERERLREKEQIFGTSGNGFGSDNRGFIYDEKIKTESDDLHLKSYNYEGKPALYDNPMVAKMAAMTETPRATHINRQGLSDATKHVPPAKDRFHEEVTKKLEQLRDSKGNVIDTVDGGPMATSTGKHSRSSRPTSGRGRRGSNVTDQDGNVVTSEAFGFLDGYSDGEGTDFLGSGSLTPTEMRDQDIMF